MEYTIADQEGRILCVVGCPESELAATLAQIGGTRYVVGSVGLDEDIYLEGDAFCRMPTQPSPQHIWDWPRKTWSDPRTLRDLKDAKWVEMKKAREATIVAPLLATRFGIFDADVVGMANIRSVAADLREAAAVGRAPISIDWTMADNSTVVLTPLQLSEVVSLLMVRTITARKRARTVRTQIEAASSTSQLAALVWSSTP